MRKLGSVLLALLVLGLPMGVLAQGNPFFGDSSRAPAVPSQTVPSLRIEWVIEAQRVIREILSDAISRTTRDIRGVLFFLGLVFVYGFLHALGPGHRKMALAGYFMARPGRCGEGVMVGISVTLLHAGSTVVIVYGLYFLLRRSVSAAFSSASTALEIASYAAILVLGLVLFSLAVRKWVRNGRFGQASCGSEPEHSGDQALAAIILGSGIVPCPGAALVLILCLSQNLPRIGVLAVLSMSAGMAVVTVGVSLAVILGKRGLLSVLPSGTRFARIFGHGIEILGTMVLIAFGLLMLAPYIAGASAR